MVCLQNGGHLFRSMLTDRDCVLVGSTVGNRRFVQDGAVLVDDGFELIDGPQSPDENYVRSVYICYCVVFCALFVCCCCDFQCIFFV